MALLHQWEAGMTHPAQQIQYFKSQKSVMAEFCWAFSHCLVCQELTWSFAVHKAKVPSLSHCSVSIAIPRSPWSRSASCHSTILPTDKFHRKHPKLLPCSSILGSTAPSSNAPPLQSLHFYWALLVPSYQTELLKLPKLQWALLSGVPVSGVWTPFCLEQCSGCFLTHHYQSHSHIPSP